MNDLMLSGFFRKQMLHNVSAEGHKTEKRYVEFP